MENVPALARHKVFHNFVNMLKRHGYNVWFDAVESAHYGVPQTSRRLILLASMYGEMKMVKRTHQNPKTVREAIGRMRPLSTAGNAKRDKLHVSSKLSGMNLRRMKASRPGGSWRDWPRYLVADCHQAESGSTFSSVYGRMEWDKPAPTITTQFYGFGNGRFGHPTQNRAISLREGAILQGFPRNYAFVPCDGRVRFKTLGRLIGNAVPVNLARAIARSVIAHIATLHREE